MDFLSRNNSPRYSDFKFKICRKDGTDQYRKCPVFLGRNWQYDVNNMVQIFLNSIRNEFPVEQCGAKSPPGVAAYTVPPIEVPVPYVPTYEICYVDLIIALDMGCMNFDEYATGK